MKRTVSVVTAVFLAWLALPVAAEDLDFSIEGPRIVGGDVGLALGPWKLTGGAGYENWELGRDAATGTPTLEKLNWWALSGTSQLSYRWDTPEALFWAGAGGTGVSALGSAPTSAAFSDLGGTAWAYVQAGALRDRRTKGPHGVVEGHFLQLSAEASPSFLSVTANDYYKVAFRSGVLIPLWNLDAPAHLFSGTLGFRANAQWIDGRSVPVALLEPTEVRGYQNNRESKFRSVVSTELRMGLPSLWGDHNLVPMVFAFADGGWYAGYADAPAAWSGASGWLAGVGGGVGLGVWGLATPTFSVGLPLVDDSGLWYKINFNLRF